MNADNDSRLIGDEEEADVWAHAFSSDADDDEPTQKSFSEQDHPRAPDGQFGSGGGESDKPTTPKRSILTRAKDAGKKAGSILGSGVKVPIAAVKGAKKLGGKLMDGIENRYGKNVKRAVSIGVMLSLPVPVPGMSVAVAAPIIAMAELHRQIMGKAVKAAEEEVDAKLVKRLVKHLVGKMFGGNMPDDVDLDAMDKDESDDEAEEEKATPVIIVKEFEAVTKEKPKMICKDLLGAPLLKKDPSKMYVRAIITTNTIDRDYQIVNPSGCYPDSFALGPASWFMNHQQFPFAVGSAKESPLEKECPIDIEIAEEYTGLGCFFNQATKEAEILYVLVAEYGHMGNTSIGFNPMGEPEVLSMEESDKFGSPRRVERFNQWELLESSWVGIGSNRYAMNEIFQRGYVGSLKIPETMNKFFAPFILPKKALTNGWTPPMIDTITNQRSIGKSMGTLSDTRGGTMADESSTFPASHDLLQHMVKGTHALIEGAMPHLMKADDGPIKAGCLKMCKSAWDMAGGLHKSAKGMYKGMDEMPELPEGAEDMMKSVPAEDPEEAEETKDETPEELEAPDKEKDESVDDDVREELSDDSEEDNIDDDLDDDEEDDELKSLLAENRKLCDENNEITKQVLALK